MINKRLINTVKDSKKYIFSNVLCQWITLLSNFDFVTYLALMIEKLWLKEQFNIFAYLIYMLISILVRAIMTKLSIRMGYLASKEVKKVLREKIYQKLLSLQGSYKEQINTSELVQIAVEGVDQLEVYFSSYLPQFFYAMLAPLSLFIYLSFIDIKSAIVLFICVPLIPVSIIIVQKWAKKLLSKYWGQYTALGDTFLENLQGLTTLKVYQSDQYKNEKMNEEGLRAGRIIKAPDTASYECLLKGNVIGNLTGIYDVAKVGKVLFRPIHHEDYALWLSILKKGFIARNTNTVTALYRVRKASVSSRKLAVLSWQWNIYMNVEKIGIIKSAYYYINYACRALHKKLI